MRRNVRRRILSAFNNRRVGAVGAKGVSNWLDGISTTHPSLSSWALAAMSSLMKGTETLGMRPEDSNPYRTAAVEDGPRSALPDGGRVRHARTGA